MTDTEEKPWDRETRQFKEAARYLGYGRKEPDEATARLLREELAELSETARVKSFYRVYDLKLLENSDFEIEGIVFHSKNLSRNLGGCARVAMMGVTLGTGVDRLLSRYGVTDVTRMVVLQAAAAAYLEEECDLIQSEIAKKARTEGLFLRPRFSPGYGDFDIHYQRDVARILDLPRKTGITLTDSMMMAPSKSVTALIGMTPVPGHCVSEGCEVCNKKDCAFRRNG